MFASLKPSSEHSPEQDTLRFKLLHAFAMGNRGFAFGILVFAKSDQIYAGTLCARRRATGREGWRAKPSEVPRE